MNLLIEPLKDADLPAFLVMAGNLWPDEDLADLPELIKNAKQFAFIAKLSNSPVGFMTLALRHDYVEGSSTSPVGYLEGIYIESKHRHQGFGRQLIKAAEGWARQQGCSELGSDTLLDNQDSQAFHQAVGFKKAPPIQPFIKRL